MIKRLEVYWTDIEDILSLAKEHFGFTCEPYEDEIAGHDSGGETLFDCTSDIIKSRQKWVDEAVTEMTDYSDGTVSLNMMIMALIKKGHLEPGHYLVSATWG